MQDEAASSDARAGSMGGAAAMSEPCRGTSISFSSCQLSAMRMGARLAVVSDAASERCVSETAAAEAKGARERASHSLPVRPVAGKGV